MSFLLSIGGGTYSFDALSVTAASLDVTNQGRDSLKLTLGEDMASTTPFAAFDKVMLHDEEGSQRFIGWVDRPKADAQGRSQEWSVLISGPWHWLDATPLSQLFVDTSAAPATISTVPVQVPLLNQGTDANGNLIKVQMGQFISTALTLVTAKYGSVIGWNASDLTALTLDLPYSEKQNVSVGSVIRDQLAWLPSHALWWDYSGATPTLRITAPGAATNQVTSTGVDADKIVIDPRLDLLANRVKITYLSEITETTSNQVIRSTSVDDSGGPLGDANTLGCPYEIDLTYALTREEPVPLTGLATAYATAVSTLHLDTQFQIYDESLLWGYLPGQTWGYSGIASQWSAYTSSCQTITRDLFHHTITLHLGAPGHLGLSSLIDLHKKNIPQVAGRGGAGGNAYAPVSLSVYIAIAWGTSSDYADAITDCFVTVIGPGGPVTKIPDISGDAMIFNNLPPGTYTVLVTLSTDDWVVASDTVGISLVAGATASTTITLTRLDSLSLIDDTGASVILDAVDGISINNGSDNTEDPDGQSSLDGSQLVVWDTTYSATLDSSSLSLEDADNSSIVMDIQEGSLVITDPSGKAVTVEVPYHGSTPLNASFQQIVVCVGGVNKNALVLMSEYFT